MRRAAALMTLIAALTGTPLRQAEAADDFGRALLAWIEPAGIEIPDGGVGDDAGVGTLSTPHGGGHVAPLTLAAPLPLQPVPAGPPLARTEGNALREPVWWTSKPPNTRHAWLQAFLF